MITPWSRLKEQGRPKSPERVIEAYIPAQLIAATDEATNQLGVGPGAVRFIDGTFVHHINLEKKVADFVGKPGAKIFNNVQVLAFVP